VIRINRIALVAAVIATGLAAQAHAQVVIRDDWADRAEARYRADHQREMMRDH
jgi:hypothetical protein